MIICSREVITLFLSIQLNSGKLFYETVGTAQELVDEGKEKSLKFFEPSKIEDVNKNLFIFGIFSQKSEGARPSVLLHRRRRFSL